MNILEKLREKTEQIDFLFPRTFHQLMNDPYYDYDKFEWFLYYVFKMDDLKVEKIGRKGRGDGGADLILTRTLNSGGIERIGIQAKYWKNRVGTEPINQLASAKSRHSLTSLWIITTSDLTSDAKEIAESLGIHILRAEDVEFLIKSVIEKHDKDVLKKGSSSIIFLESKVIAPKKIVKPSKSTLNSTKSKDVTFEDVQKLRQEIAKKYKIYPIYNVFNNNTAEDIVKNKPTTKEELLKIVGIGPKKLEQFGQDILNFINSSKKDENSLLYDKLLKERVRIARYNKLSESDVYSDKVALMISKIQPKNLLELKKISGINVKGVDIFGDYLIKFINS